MESISVLETCLKTYILHNPKLGGVVEWAAECPWFHEPSQRKWMHHLRGISFFIEQWCLCSHRALLCQLLYCQFLSSCRIQWKIYFASTLPTSFTVHPIEVFKLIHSLEAESWPSHTWLCLQRMQEASMNKSIVLNITLANLIERTSNQGIKNNSFFRGGNLITKYMSLFSKHARSNKFPYPKLPYPKFSLPQQIL